ncbi:MAG: hypothetical protein M5U09_22185 [Gammaproteobacteria bacterium]|nr:hypothetical protein [Gammaproteobacteria bacterium]
MTAIPFLVMLLCFVLVLLGGIGLGLLLLGQRAQRQRGRRWARVANRRAPLRPGQTSYDKLLDHLDGQIDTLLAERHRLELLIQKGERLKGMMQASAQMRPRLPTIERTLRLLRQKGSALDNLIGRYHQHRDDLGICRAAELFNRDLEAYEANAVASDPFGAFQVTTEELDEETSRLLLVAEAEDELTELLRS